MNPESVARLSRIWVVEWSVAQRPGQYSLGLTTVGTKRQYFESADAADAFKKSLVQAAALLGTGVSPVLSEVEVK